MDYFEIYDDLMSTADTRNVDLHHCEMHHIKPRCRGGSDDAQNLAKLTFREHYLAHKLLVKMHPDDKLLANALWMMTVTTNASLRKLKSSCKVDSRMQNRLRSMLEDDKMCITSYDYAFSKLQHVKHMIGHQVSDTTRKLISDSTKRAMQSKDIIQRCASGSKGSRHYYNKKTLEQHKWLPGQPEIDLQIYAYGRPPMSQKQKEKISALKSLHKTKCHNDQLQITLDVYHDCICKVPEGWLPGKVDYRNNAAFKKFIYQVKSMLMTYDIFFDNIFAYTPSCVSKKKKMLNPAFFDVCQNVLHDWKSNDNVVHVVVMYIRDNIQLAKMKANEYLKEGFKK